MTEPVVISQTRTDTVDLDVTEMDVSVDTGVSALPKMTAVSRLTISYKRTQGRHGVVATGVTGITYKVAEEGFDSISIHPGHLDQPQAWPDWVRALVCRYRPGP